MKQTLGITAMVLLSVCGVAAATLGEPLVRDLRERADIRYAARVWAYKFQPGTADVVMLGDSITDEGDWPDLLPGVKIMDRGIWGDTSAGVLARLPEVMWRRPRIVFLMVGVNDVSRLGIAPEQVEANIRAAVRTLRKNRIGVVLQSVLFRSKGSEANPRIGRLNALLRAVAAEEAVPFLDLNAVLAPAGTLLPEVTYDGLHLNARGYLIWVEALRPFFAQFRVR